MHPPIAEPTIILNIIRDASVPLLGTNLGGGILCTHSSAASQLAVGFHYIGPAPRNPQLKLNLLVVRGCVATARRPSYVCHGKLSYNPTDKLQFTAVKTNKNFMKP